MTNSTAHYFNQTDFAFIELIAVRFPEKKILEQFAFYIDMPAEQRPDYAAAELYKIPRAGWVRTGTPADQAETIGQHTDEMKHLLETEMKLIGEKLTRCQQMAADHDLGEIIISDFTPRDDITKTEKNRLEQLAIRVLFEAHPERLALWEEHEAGKTHHAKLVKDVDQLQMYLEAWRKLEQYPQRSEHIHYVEHNYADNKILTHRGSDFYSRIQDKYWDKRSLLMPGC